MLAITLSGSIVVGTACVALYDKAFAAPTFSSTSSQSSLASVLQAPLNSDLHPHIGLTDKVVDGEALMNDRRPTKEHAPEETGVTPTSGDQISVYVVREGDTLSKIAEMYNVTENTIRWANELGAKGTIKKDQQLIILPISGVKYVVKKGDTAKSIANAWKSDADEILSFNSLENTSDLKVGMEIIIPNGEAAGSTTSTGTKGGTKTSGTVSTGSSSGYFVRPIKGGVRTQGIHGNNGIDIASSLGTPVYAAASGKVIIAKTGGWNGGYGNYVVISHSNGTQTLYGHLNTVSVVAGQNITKGTKIGGMGTTGKSTGVHLHFEVRGGKNPF